MIENLCVSAMIRSIHHLLNIGLPTNECQINCYAQTIELLIRSYGAYVND